MSMFEGMICQKLVKFLLCGISNDRLTKSEYIYSTVMARAVHCVPHVVYLPSVITVLVFVGLKLCVMLS